MKWQTPTDQQVTTTMLERNDELTATTCELARNLPEHSPKLRLLTKLVGELRFHRKRLLLRSIE